jgi:hypothetical protein
LAGKAERELRGYNSELGEAGDSELVHTSRNGHETGRGDLVGLVHLVCLVHLVYLVCLVCLVYLVEPD